jgi:hypothetical protein
VVDLAADGSTASNPHATAVVPTELITSRLFIAMFVTAIGAELMVPAA